MKKRSLVLIAAISSACLMGCSASASKAAETTVETTAKIETSAENVSVEGADNTSSENMTLARNQIPGLDDEKLNKIAEILNEKTFEKGERISLKATGFKDCDDTSKKAFILLLGRFADYDEESCELIAKEKTELKFTFTSEKISYSFKAFK